MQRHRLREGAGDAAGSLSPMLAEDSLKHYKIVSKSRNIHVNRNVDKYKI